MKRKVFCLQVLAASCFLIVFFASFVQAGNNQGQKEIVRAWIGGFANGSSKLTDDMRVKIMQTHSLIKENAVPGKVEVDVYGVTNKAGFDNKKYDNQALAKKRAVAVAGYLENVCGIQVTNIIGSAYDGQDSKYDLRGALIVARQVSGVAPVETNELLGEIYSRNMDQFDGIRGDLAVILEEIRVNAARSNTMPQNFMKIVLTILIGLAVLTLLLIWGFSDNSDNKVVVQNGPGVSPKAVRDIQRDIREIKNKIPSKGRLPNTKRISNLEIDGDAYEVFAEKQKIEGEGEVLVLPFFRPLNGGNDKIRRGTHVIFSDQDKISKYVRDLFEKAKVDNVLGRFWRAQISELAIDGELKEKGPRVVRVKKDKMDSIIFKAGDKKWQITITRDGKKWIAPGLEIPGGDGILSADSEEEFTTVLKDFFKKAHKGQNDPAYRIYYTCFQACQKSKIIREIT